ncbi:MULTISPECIES: acetate/propionate family kinase [Pseudomonas]|uniref:acetate/propionate family kinase n=1 Tax=Pseudomonas TaxID=286 RepID=UPI0011101E67|nr:acetate/propionate family kinase [Pseudomonas sp. MPC6]QCY12265.1 acetate/propionate family kinase [Pseudomonas sp. MPC6]
MNDTDNGEVILVLNAGSSSIKFALFDATCSPLARTPLWRAKVDGITGPNPVVSENGGDDQPLTLDEKHPYHDALAYIRERLRTQLVGRSIRAIAHRVVHGGIKYSKPVLIDTQVLADLKSYIPLAPLHQPFALEAIETLLQTRPDLPQVVCFDTAFHQTLPDVEKILPLPWSAWESGLRRYGFHGLSYCYQSIALAERYGDQARGRTLVAHLGSGASLCGMRDLKSVATTMGFSALDGLMMGSRCGSLDPGAVIFLMEIWKLSLERVSHILYHESGLLGVSGISSDPRQLLKVETTEPRAAMALALYLRRFIHEAGALVAALGGLDMLVFTAGIGEHNATIRARMCAGLQYLGVELNETANQANASVISTPASRVKVVVEPTNEEWVTALDALRLTEPANLQQ